MVASAATSWSPVPGAGRAGGRGVPGAQPRGDATILQDAQAQPPATGIAIEHLLTQLLMAGDVARA